MDRKNRIVLATVMLAVALACAPLLPQVAPLPEQPEGAVSTIVAGTRAAAATQTQAVLPPTFTPSATRPPTKTPTVTPSPTATIIFKLPTFAPTKIATATKKSSGGGGSGGGGGGGGGGGDDDTRYQCTVVSTVVRVNNVIVPGPKPTVPANTVFTVTWTVKNIGTTPWDHNSVDFRYHNGYPFHSQVLYDFPNVPATVSRGMTVDLVVDNPPMLSPSTPNTYKSFWTLQASHTRFCDLSVTIAVP